MTELTSLGSQSSRLNMEHFRQLQELRLELAPELGPADVAAEADRLSADDTFRLSADAGSRISEQMSCLPTKDDSDYIILG